MSSLMHQVTCVYETADGLTAQEEAIFHERTFNKPPPDIFRPVIGYAGYKHYKFVKKEGSRFFYKEFFMLASEQPAPPGNMEVK